MELKSKIKKLYLHFMTGPLLLAIPIAIVIIILLPENFHRYSVKLLTEELADKPDSYECFSDLDRDGRSEHIVMFHNEMDNAAVKIIGSDNVLVDQWNFIGKIANRPYFNGTFDLNKDGFAEIYLFTFRHDSLYLNAFQPFPDKTVLLKDRFISTIGVVGGKADPFVSREEGSDLDGDGLEELIFVLNTGFSRQPRGIFIYYPDEDSLLHTPPLGANLNRMFISDLDNDGYPEICASGSTKGNVHDSLGIPYSDYSSWLFAYDRHLHPLFHPKEFPFYPSSIKTLPLQSAEGQNLILASFSNLSNSDTPSAMYVFNYKGDTLYKRSGGVFEGKPGYYSSLNIINKDGKDVILTNEGTNEFLYLDDKLNVLRKKEFSAQYSLRLVDDLDNNGEDDLLFITTNFDMVITTADLDNMVKVPVNWDPFRPSDLSISIRENLDRQNEIVIKSGDILYFFTFGPNPYHYLKYPLWLGIFIIVLAFISLIRYIIRLQLERKIEIENRINALQLKTIRSQMDPHFMFNALNSISGSIMMERKETAYRYMVKFSHLLRSLFTKADSLSVPLSAEIEFVKNYLELEKFRYKEKLSFQINIGEKVDMSLQIPRMLIHLFVENAIKHGIKNKIGEGHLFINVKKRDRHTHILIEDDGIGRKAAESFQEGNGKGLVIINEMIELYRKLSGSRIYYIYQDKYSEEGKAAGTRVTVIIT